MGPCVDTVPGHVKRQITDDFKPSGLTVPTDLSPLLLKQKEGGLPGLNRYCESRLHFIYCFCRAGPQRLGPLPPTGAVLVGFDGTKDSRIFSPIVTSLPIELAFVERMIRLSQE